MELAVPPSRPSVPASCPDLFREYKVTFRATPRFDVKRLDAGAMMPSAIAAIRLLMLTGCRKSEILTLRWSDVDLQAGEIRLADAKSGPRAVQLSLTAVGLLEALPRLRDSP